MGKIIAAVAFAFIITFGMGFLVGNKNKRLIIEEQTRNFVSISEDNDLIFYSDQLINYEKMSKVRLSEREQIIFDYLAEKYTKKYNLPNYLPYLFAAIESDFSLNSLNKASGATGIFQITPVCLSEYNNYHKEKYNLEDMYKIEESFEVSMWYINRLHEHYDVSFTIDNPVNLYIAYNIGPINFKKGKSYTQRTSARYANMAEEINIAYIGF